MHDLEAAKTFLVALWAIVAIPIGLIASQQTGEGDELRPSPAGFVLGLIWPAILPMCAIFLAAGLIVLACDAAGRRVAAWWRRDWSV